MQAFCRCCERRLTNDERASLNFYAYGRPLWFKDKRWTIGDWCNRMRMIREFLSAERAFAIAESHLAKSSDGARSLRKRRRGGAHSGRGEEAMNRTIKTLPVLYALVHDEGFPERVYRTRAEANEHIVIDHTEERRMDPRRTLANLDPDDRVLAVIAEAIERSVGCDKEEAGEIAHDVRRTLHDSCALDIACYR